MAGELRGGRGHAHGRDEGDLPSADHLRLALPVRLALTHTSPFPLLLSASHQHLRCLPLTRCGLVPGFACDPQHVAMQKLMQVFDSSSRSDLRRSHLFRRTP